VKKGASVTLILYGLAGVLTGVFAFL